MSSETTKHKKKRFCQKCEDHHQRQYFILTSSNYNLPPYADVIQNTFGDTEAIPGMVYVKVQYNPFLRFFNWLISLFKRS